MGQWTHLFFFFLTMDTSFNTEGQSSYWRIQRKGWRKAGLYEAWILCCRHGFGALLGNGKNDYLFLKRMEKHGWTLNFFFVLSIAKAFFRSYLNKLCKNDDYHEIKAPDSYLIFHQVNNILDIAYIAPNVLLLFMVLTAERLSPKDFCRE